MFCALALHEQVLPPTINYRDPGPGVRPRLRAEQGAAGRRDRGRDLERDGPRRPQRVRPARPRRLSARQWITKTTTTRLTRPDRIQKSVSAGRQEMGRRSSGASRAFPRSAPGHPAPDLRLGRADADAACRPLAGRARRDRGQPGVPLEDESERARRVAELRVGAEVVRPVDHARRRAEQRPHLQPLHAQRHPRHPALRHQQGGRRASESQGRDSEHAEKCRAPREASSSGVNSSSESRTWAASASVSGAGG